MNLAYFLAGFPGGMELIVIILVIVLLFGGKKIPELMKGLGQGLKEFKKAKNQNDNEEEKTNNKEALKD